MGVLVFYVFIWRERGRQTDRERKRGRQTEIQSNRQVKEERKRQTDR